MRIVFVFLFMVAFFTGFGQNSEVTMVMVSADEATGMKLIEFTDIKTIIDKNVLDTTKSLFTAHSKIQSKVLFKSI